MKSRCSVERPKCMPSAASILSMIGFEWKALISSYSIVCPCLVLMTFLFALASRLQVSSWPSLTQSVSFHVFGTGNRRTKPSLICSQSQKTLYSHQKVVELRRHAPSPADAADSKQRTRPCGGAMRLPFRRKNGNPKVAFAQYRQASW